MLDLGLPDIDGIEVIAGIRGWSAVPIIVLSARTTSDEKVEALDAGADDYLAKPFAMNELLARVRAAVRRATAGAAEDAAALQVVTDSVHGRHRSARGSSAPGADVRLTPTEWSLLESLARNVGGWCPSASCSTRCGDPATSRQTHYLRVYMAQLRRKLEPDPAHPVHLLTEPGVGYRLQP